MSGTDWIAIATVVLGASGCYLMLPHRHGHVTPRHVHVVGFVLAALGVLLMLGFWTAAGPWLSRLFFYVFAISAVIAGILMITNRNPVHSALWFAAVVLSTSGLFLLLGAQFLAAGTVIVYAGAIIVTFLFVIMLAQSKGQALYDRTARTPGRATFACFLLFWALLQALLNVQRGSVAEGSAHSTPLLSTTELASTLGQPGLTAVLDQAVPSRTARVPSIPGDAPAPGVPVPHVAGIGSTLYTDHLITIEVVGAILFVALVGAAAIATPRRPVRPVPGGD